MKGKDLSKGRITDKHFARGYQAALADIAQKLDEGGEAAVVEWLTNNMTVYWNGRKVSELTRMERRVVASQAGAQLKAELEEQR
jgi:hypothetical protein